MDLFVLLTIAGVALFVLAKLYAVLGRDVGAPSPPQTTKPLPVSEISQISEKPLQSQISFAGLAALQKSDSAFDPGDFLDGARTAYEMIVSAFANGDRDVLRPLLEDPVYENYNTAISERESGGRNLQMDIVRMHGAKIIEAESDESNTYVTVEFHTDLSIIEKNQEGEMLETADSELAETKEQWTFSRRRNSNDPNWRLSAVAAIA